MMSAGSWRTAVNHECRWGAVLSTVWTSRCWRPLRTVLIGAVAECVTWEEVQQNLRGVLWIYFASGYSITVVRVSRVFRVNSQGPEKPVITSFLHRSI